MAETSPQTMGPRRDPRRALLWAAPRAAALAVGLFLGVGILAARLVGGHDLTGLRWLGLYAASTIFFWGFVGLFSRRLVLGPITTPLFGAAFFGVLVLLGYLLSAVLGDAAAMFVTRILPELQPSVLAFYALAVMTCAGAGGVAFSRNIIYSAWALLFAFIGVAGLYIFLGADFPAVAQVMIYVGGILVLILFAIMLTKQIGDDPKITNVHFALPVGGLLGALAIGVLSYMAVMAPWKLVDKPSFEPGSQTLGMLFLDEFLLPFEVASVVLLAALIGAVVIARKEIKETTDIG